MEVEVEGKGVSDKRPGTELHRRNRKRLQRKTELEPLKDEAENQPGALPQEDDHDHRRQE